MSLDGVQNGDFTMIMGYPGSTDRFLSSHGVQQALDIYNPSVVEVRDLKLKTMKTHMDADPGCAHSIRRQVCPNGQLLEVLHRPVQRAPCLGRLRQERKHSKMSLLPG